MAKTNFLTHLQQHHFYCFICLCVEISISEMFAFTLLQGRCLSFLVIKRKKKLNNATTILCFQKLFTLLTFIHRHHCQKITLYSYYFPPNQQSLRKPVRQCNCVSVRLIYAPLRFASGNAWIIITKAEEEKLVYRYTECNKVQMKHT